MGGSERGVQPLSPILAFALGSHSETREAFCDPEISIGCPPPVSKRCPLEPIDVARGHQSRLGSPALHQEDDNLGAQILIIKPTQPGRPRDSLFLVEEHFLRSDFVTLISVLIILFHLDGALEFSSAYQRPECAQQPCLQEKYGFNSSITFCVSRDHEFGQ